MRRIVLILLAVALVPSIATASWYRCADGVTRATCCCASAAHRPHRTPPPGTALRAASCCTVTQVPTAPPAPRSQSPTPVHVDPVAVPVAVAPVAVHRPGRAASLARPRAPGDPPDTLFARRCSLLL